MTRSKDPFEAAFEESPPDSPIQTTEPDLLLLLDPPPDTTTTDNPHQQPTPPTHINNHQHVTNNTSSTSRISNTTKINNEEEDEDEDNIMDVELAKFPTTGDPHKMAKMQAILSQFTEEQMSRYESFRRAGFHKANMKRLLASITGTQKISIPITIAVSGIAKVFVGEVVETARTVMKERKESGPIRPCHLREAHRRLKLEGKIFKRTTSRLFR